MGAAFLDDASGKSNAALKPTSCRHAQGAGQNHTFGIIPVSPLALYIIVLRWKPGTVEWVFLLLLIAWQVNSHRESSASDIPALYNSAAE